MTARYDYGVLSEVLKQAIKKKQLTYADLADRLGISESGLKKIMSGDDVSLSRLAAICEAAELDLMAVLEAAWKAPPEVFHHTPEQIEFFRANPAYYNFLIALLQSGLDLAKVARDYDLDEPSIVRYLGKLEDLGLVEVLPEGRIRSVIPAPFRTAGPDGVDDGKRAFIAKLLDPATEGRRIVMAGLRMTREHFEQLKTALHKAILDHGVLAHQDELTRSDDELIAVHVIAGLAPLRHCDYVTIPRLPPV